MGTRSTGLGGMGAIGSRAGPDTGDARARTSEGFALNAESPLAVDGPELDFAVGTSAFGGGLFAQALKVIAMIASRRFESFMLSSRWLCAATYCRYNSLCRCP